MNRRLLIPLPPQKSVIHGQTLMAKWVERHVTGSSHVERIGTKIGIGGTEQNVERNEFHSRFFGTGTERVPNF